MEGPWVVKLAVGSTPVILGQKITIRYFRGKKITDKSIIKSANESIVNDLTSKNENSMNNSTNNESINEITINNSLNNENLLNINYLEIDFHISSSSIASNIVGLCRGYAKSYICNMGIVIQGENCNELPEKLLACFSVNYIDLDVSSTLE